MADDELGLTGDFGAASKNLLNAEGQRRAAVNDMMSRFTLPGRAAQGVQPETPGVMTEADAFRMNKLEDEAQMWGPKQALGMVGGGVPQAERSALGAAGGKAFQYPKAVEQTAKVAEAHAAYAAPEKDTIPVKSPGGVEFYLQKPADASHYITPKPGDDAATLAFINKTSQKLKSEKSPAKTDIEEAGKHLKPLAWQAEKPPVDKELHPHERVVYEKILADPERAKKAHAAGFNIQQPLFKGGYEGYPDELKNPAKHKDQERGFFLASDPKVAEAYKTSGVMPYLARAENAHEVHWPTAVGNDVYATDPMHQLIEAAHSKHVDMLVIRGVHDLGSKEPQDQFVVLNPAILRAPDAKFDYEKLLHAAPLAGVAGTAIILNKDGTPERYIPKGSQIEYQISQ